MKYTLLKKWIGVYQKPKITKGEAWEEIKDLRQRYVDRFSYDGQNWCGGFLVGTCIGKTQHPGGDSGRFHELLKIIES